jgi:HEPN domain-containing protein
MPDTSASLCLRGTSASQWLDFALEDINSAKKLASPPDPIWPTAVFHCQQAAEKASKAMLVLTAGAFTDEMRSHDIGHLIQLLFRYKVDVRSLEVQAESLTDFATSHRYPGSASVPLTQAVVEQAIADAELFLIKARELIPNTNSRASEHK